MTVLAADSTARPSLAVAMRDGSRSEHEAAENSTFMAELLGGSLAPTAYADLLVCLRDVYAALEAVVRDRADDPIVAAVHDPALERLAAIETDLEFWLPLASGESASPAAAAYAERLQGLDWGGQVVAHHYTRYLGDLSGGQAIGRMLARTYDLADGVGTAFYRFEAIEKPKPYKDGYRSRLDALGLDARQVEQVVTEVKAAFELNRGIFVELGDRLADYRAA